jgi:hypothetical protein
VEVAEGTRDIFSDLLHATVDANAAVELLLFFRGGWRTVRVATRLEADEVATTTVHGSAESWEDDGSTGGYAFAFGEGSGGLSVVWGGRS